MRSHLRALASALAPLGYPVHLLHAAPASSDADDQDVVPPVPFLVLRGAWGSPEQMPVCDVTDDLDTAVFITCTAGTAEGALVVADRVRAHLSPGRRWTALAVDGRAAQIRWVRNEVEPQIDRDLRLPGSNRHPGFAVDSYRLHSTPLTPKEGS